MRSIFFMVIELLTAFLKLELYDTGELQAGARKNCTFNDQNQQGCVCNLGF